MGTEASKPLPAFGFLTVLEDPQHGFFGGYLAISQLGRPLEFHCSTPVLPNQAQRILYGATLRSYVLGELIGQTLLAKSQLPVQAVVTDQEEMLSLALLREETIALLSHDDQATGTQSELPVPTITVGGYRLQGTSTCVWQVQELQQSFAELAAHVELREPFERICEAIREAHRGRRAA